MRLPLLILGCFLLSFCSSAPSKTKSCKQELEEHPNCKIKALKDAADCEELCACAKGKRPDHESEPCLGEKKKKSCMCAPCVKKDSSGSGSSSGSSESSSGSDSSSDTNEDKAVDVKEKDESESKDTSGSSSGSQGSSSSSKENNSGTTTVKPESVNRQAKVDDEDQDDKEGKDDKADKDDKEDKDDEGPGEVCMKNIMVKHPEAECTTAKDRDDCMAVCEGKGNAKCKESQGEIHKLNCKGEENDRSDGRITCCCDIKCESEAKTKSRLQEEAKKVFGDDTSGICVNVTRATSEDSGAALKAELKELCSTKDEVFVARKFCLEERKGKYFCVKDGHCLAKHCLGCLKHECELDGEKAIVNPPDDYMKKHLELKDFDKSVSVNVDDVKGAEKVGKWCTMIEDRSKCKGKCEDFGNRMCGGKENALKYDHDDTCKRNAKECRCCCEPVCKGKAPEEGDKEEQAEDKSEEKSEDAEDKKSEEVEEKTDTDDTTTDKEGSEESSSESTTPKAMDDAKKVEEEMKAEDAAGKNKPPSKGEIDDVSQEDTVEDTKEEKDKVVKEETESESADES